jgi:hypothetical protein
MTHPLFPPIDFHTLYGRFDAPVVPIDCGRMCAPQNPNGKPFCCDICHAVPAVYHPEWAYLSSHTDLWHIWRGDECTENPEDPALLLADTPEHMLLLACLGPQRCQRAYRALSCRQFPFTPYISSRLRFLGLTFDWEFESTCWVIRHLDQVTEAYRFEFIQTYEQLFAAWPGEWQGYIVQSEDIRAHYTVLKRRIPLLHRDGGLYQISPVSERMRRSNT